MSLLNLLPTSKLGLQGKQGPIFDNSTSSDIQALVRNQNLVSSQDMILGRFYGSDKWRTYTPPSQLDLNGTTPEKYLDNPPL